MKKNIHIILAFSPLGSTFITRLRMFPSLVCCCTIDYYSEWPEEALLSVAEGAITEEMDLGSERAGVVKMFSTMHQSVEVISQKWLNEVKRYN